METKKLIPILVLTTCLSSLGACTQNNQKVSFGGYWQANSLITENLHEKLLYDVEYNDDNAAMYDYTINYTNGQYVTELQSATENGKNILIYKTELTINVTYTHKGTTSEVFEDKVVTEAKFYTADNSLRPISSFKELVSTSPANNGSTLESCYHKFHYETRTVRGVRRPSRKTPTMKRPPQKRRSLPSTRTSIAVWITKRSYLQSALFPQRPTRQKFKRIARLWKENRSSPFLSRRKPLRNSPTLKTVKAKREISLTAP